ncbi:acyltransferase ChoActase/COT/CPT [Mycena rebaudengoi]|nr:acyltransferase ChoActase/COT/CPT [Mycena rebaudengoi]
MRRASSSAPLPKPLSLPRLPVPDLRKTLDRYLRSLEPFLLEDEAHGGLPFVSAYALRAKWADQFAQGVGILCQARLLALDRASPHNWLDDNFWMNKAYLESREPLPVNSNWWLAYLDDMQIPDDAKKVEAARDVTPWQVRRGAWLVHRTLAFKDRLDRQELYPDTTRTGIWLRESTAKLFNIARTPKPKCDILSKPPHPAQASAHNIYIMVHDWCYAVRVYRPPTTSESTESAPQLLDVQTIEARIRAAVVDAQRRRAAGETAVPVGVLSADGRDRWAQNLQRLLALSPANHRTHQALSHALLGLSLDTDPNSDSSDFAHDPSHTSHLRAVRTTYSNVANRLFDKPLTLVVDPGARAGMTGEHSPCDALVPSIVAEWSLVEGVDAACFAEGVPAAFGAREEVLAGADGEAGWARLDWEVDDALRTECVHARARADVLIAESDDDVFWFEEYGTDWMKSALKQSPDGYIQMALQLAYFKSRGEFTATYETALTRMFKRGRTETIRSFTRESRAWVLGMVDGSTSQQTRRNLLHHALHAHSTLTREAATGRGIDRHLLGLRLMLRPLNGEQAALFEDELFARSQRWTLSTSGLSAGNLFKGTGFGASYEDGYGINYLAAPDMIKFGIESKYSCPHTSTDGFKDAVFEALSDMRALCLATDGAAVSPKGEQQQVSSRL